MQAVFFMIGFLLVQQPLAYAKANGDSLFMAQAPQDIALTLSIRKVAKSKDDSVYSTHTLHYYNANKSAWDSIEIGIKARGNFRLKHCYFPPITISIKGKNARGTVFEGNKKLKLVLPCDQARGSNELIVREYLCYKLYEVFTQYAFRTRLVNIDLTEQRKEKIRSFKLKGILIEDIDKTAKRFGATAMKDIKVDAFALDDTTALQFDFFQYLIANTDWSKSNQHNSKIIHRKDKYIPLPYDFDLSGLVDAPYAFVSLVGDHEELPIENVRQRYYRGNCRSAEATAFVRQKYLTKEALLLAVPDTLKDELSEKEIKDIKEYLKDFFDILKDDFAFRNYITDMCRQ